MTPAAVASGHPVTTDAAVATLRAGGNAFDAVVAAGFCASVAEPMLTSMAGGGFCLARDTSGAAIVDFFVDVPGLGRDGPVPAMRSIEVAFTNTTQEFHCGWGSVAVPGCLDGWLHLHRTRGRLPLRTVLEPAVAAATDGVAVTEQHAYLFEILAPINVLDAVLAHHFLPDGRPVEAGAMFRQPELAAFLDALGRDAASARADLHAALVTASDANGGALTAADLARDRVVERPPLHAAYRGHDVVTNPTPGGQLVAAQLELLAVGPPIRGWDDPSAPLRFANAQRTAELARARAASNGTTHVTVADGEGNVASMTTSNGSGSGCTVPGLGIVCNNMLGEDDLFPGGLGTGTPGERIESMMAPTMAMRDGRVVVALGSGGSKRIRTAITQVLVHRLDHEADLQRAVDGPRAHHDGSLVQVEPGFPDAALDALRAEHEVAVWAANDLYFGGVHAVAPAGPGHRPEAGGDRRRGGTTRIVRL